MSFEELAKEVGNAWRQVSADERRHYQSLAEADAERLRKEEAAAAAGAGKAKTT